FGVCRGLPPARLARGPRRLGRPPLPPSGDCRSRSGPPPVLPLHPHGAYRMTTSARAIVFYSIGVDRPITPNEPLPPLPVIPRGALVVIEGRAPIWRYGLAFHRLHSSPAGAVAVYDPRLGAVVVASHRPEFSQGQIVEATPPPANASPTPFS